MDVELVEKIEELDRDMVNLRSKLITPSQDDVITLIQITERLTRYINALKREHKDSLIKSQESKMEDLTVLAKTLIAAYIPLMTDRLVQDAKKHISTGDEQKFRHSAWEIECLNNGAGKAAYEYGWLTWDQRPWHIHDLAEKLKEEFISTNNLSFDKLNQWETEDEHNQFMAWR